MTIYKAADHDFDDVCVVAASASSGKNNKGLVVFAVYRNICCTFRLNELMMH